jgi:hypothetical protein
MGLFYFLRGGGGGSLKTKCKTDLAGIQEIRWGTDGIEPADNYISFYGDRNANHHLLLYKGIISPIKKVQFLSERIPYGVTKHPLIMILFF